MNRFRRFLSCNGCMAVSGFGMGLVGLAWGFFIHDFSAFARSGALMVGIGIISLSRTYISETELRPTILNTEGKNVFDPATYTDAGLPVHKTALDQDKNLRAIGLIGPLTSFLGTIVWGFGDLLNIPFHFVR